MRRLFLGVPMPSIKGRTSHRPRGTRRGSVSQRMDARLEVDPALGDGPDVGRLLSEMRVRAVAKGSQSPWIAGAGVLGTRARKVAELISPQVASCRSREDLLLFDSTAARRLENDTALKIQSRVGSL